MHIIKNLADLPPEIARFLIEKGIAEDLDSMVAPTPEPLRDRMATKGGRDGAHDDR